MTTCKKVVINRGLYFCVSHAAMMDYARRKGWHVHLDMDEDSIPARVVAYWLWNEYGSQRYRDIDIPRDDPDFVATVEELGSAASDHNCRLVVVEVPGDAQWSIEGNCHMGHELIVENHRTWGKHL